MDSKELVERSTDAWNAHDQESFLALYAEDCELTSPDLNGKGHQGLQQLWSLRMDAFPDNQVRVRQLIAEGDHVASEARFEGTNSGPLTNPDGTATPATGRQVSVPFTSILTVRDGKIAINRLYFDQVDLLTQLGQMSS